MVNPFVLLPRYPLVAVMSPAIVAVVAVSAPAAVTLNGEFSPSAIPSFPKNIPAADELKLFLLP